MIELPAPSIKFRSVVFLLSVPAVEQADITTDSERSVCILVFDEWPCLKYAYCVLSVAVPTETCFCADEKKSFDCKMNCSWMALCYFIPDCLLYGKSNKRWMPFIQVSKGGSSHDASSRSLITNKGFAARSKLATYKHLASNKQELNSCLSKTTRQYW